MAGHDPASRVRSTRRGARCFSPSKVSRRFFPQVDFVRCDRTYKSHVDNHRCGATSMLDVRGVMTFEQWWRENAPSFQTDRAAASAAWEAGRRDLLMVTRRACCLTAMQQRVVEAIADHWARFGRSPTQQEIADRF